MKLLLQGLLLASLLMWTVGCTNDNSNKGSVDGGHGSAKAAGQKSGVSKSGKNPLTSVPAPPQAPPAPNRGGGQ